MFENIKHVNEYGQEFWYARELSKILEYKDFRNFELTVYKAMEACENSGNLIADHFGEVTEMVAIGSGAHRALSSYQLSRYACLYPDKPFTPYVNDTLSKISERFIEMYNQALFSEHGGNLDLAAIGYRASLEILVKDYAINELKEPPQDVEKKSLFSAIGDYLHQSELISTADVIRILGNDHTHYKRKYPQHDFSLLKFYMEIFLKQIEAAYMINHPPVSRP